MAIGAGIVIHPFIGMHLLTYIIALTTARYTGTAEYALALISFLVVFIGMTAA